MFFLLYHICTYLDVNDLMLAAAYKRLCRWRKKLYCICISYKHEYSVWYVLLCVVMAPLFLLPKTTTNVINWQLRHLSRGTRLPKRFAWELLMWSLSRVQPVSSHWHCSFLLAVFEACSQLVTSIFCGLIPNPFVEHLEYDIVTSLRSSILEKRSSKETRCMKRHQLDHILDPEVIRFMETPSFKLQNRLIVRIVPYPKPTRFRGVFNQNPLNTSRDAVCS